ncbi:uncharacterized protein LOC143302057 isoform X3 [Babylonia areolata]|uniref:uncharacterized protein LOC143302057 isoform X3 n=1 Tax=Babylonia areolata TaxID=304850 RepID=UPI003FD527B2
MLSECDAKEAILKDQEKPGYPAFRTNWTMRQTRSTRLVSDKFGPSDGWWCSRMQMNPRNVLLAGTAMVVLFVVCVEYNVVGNATLRNLRPPSAMKNFKSEEMMMESIRRYTLSLPNSTEVTVVTAYFNLGSLNKMSSEGRYTQSLYTKWMAVFGRLDNPLIVFADTKDTAEHFRQLRAHYPPSRTTIILVKRKELWAFQLEAEIRRVYAQPGYPRHPPNTINALYSCAMHAKFEAVQKVVRERMYQTRYVAWLDIGLFRHEVKNKTTIHLTVPKDFDRTRVAYSQVSAFVNMTPAAIIRRNRVWVGGASFLATPEVADVYCSEYRRAVRKLLDMNWMSTDQQVIYTMFQPSFNFSAKVKLQVYTRHIRESWFDMGYLMKEAP